MIRHLENEKIPGSYLKALQGIIGNPYTSSDDFVDAVQGRIQERLTVKQEEQLLATALRNTIGPSVTDTPIRQVVYFGNNAQDQSGEPVYGILASYDDETYTSFWQGLELSPEEQRRIPISEDDQPLRGPRKVPAKMVKMLRKQLAELHFGPNSDYSSVPEPKEAAYIDWSLPPFNAGYHAWAAHYDIADVQQKIRKPSQLIEGADVNVFIVGEAYSERLRLGWKALTARPNPC